MPAFFLPTRCPQFSRSSLVAWDELQIVPDLDDVSDFSLILEGNTPPGFEEWATPLDVLAANILHEDPPRKPNGQEKTPTDLWWGEVLGQDHPRMNFQAAGSADERFVKPIFLRGFVAGACRLRDEVKEQLQA